MVCPHTHAHTRATYAQALPSLVPSLPECLIISIRLSPNAAQQKQKHTSKLTQQHHHHCASLCFSALLFFSGLVTMVTFVEEEGGGGASANVSGGSGRPSQRGRARSRYRQDHPANGGSGDASGAGGAGAGAGAGGSQRQSEDAMYAQLFAEQEEQQQEATGGKGGRKPKQQQPQFDNTKKGRRLRDRAASAAAAEAWNDPDSAKVTFGFDPSTFRRGAEDRPDGEAGEDFYDDYDTDGAHGGPVQLDPRDLLPELAALMQQQTGGKDLPPELVAMLQELEAEEGGGGDGGGDDQDMYDDDDVEYYDDEDGVDGNGDGDVDDFYYEGADDDGDDDVDGVVDMEDGRSLGVSLGSLGLRKQTTAQSHKPRPAPTDESELAALFSAPIPGQQRAGAEIEYEDEAEDEDEDGEAEDEADDDFSAFTGVEGGLEVDPFAALSAAAAAAASGMDVKSQVRFRLGKLPSNRKEGDGSEDIDSPEGFQSIRQRRIAGATQRAITKAVGLRQCGDKLTDLGFEVSHVTLAKGFRHAWVYWHATGDGAVDDQIEGQLNEQAVRIRQVVTRNLNLKFSAELRFNKTDVRMRMDELDTLFEQVGTELQATQARELRDEEQAKRAAKDAKRKKHGRRR